MPSQLTTPAQLAQRLIPATTDCVLLTLTDDSTTAIVKTIVVCNTTGSAASYSLYANQNGKVSANQFALWSSSAIAANTTATTSFSNDTGIVLSGSDASIIAKASTANAITISLYGVVLETM